MSDLSTRRIRIWNSLSFNRGRFPVCPGERLNGIQEVSGSIPLISTKGKDREPKGSLSFPFAKKFCAGANRAARGADELFIKHDRPITAFLNLFDVISHLRICRVSAKAAVIVPFPAPAVFARAGL